jgi:hypothetical protein
LKQNQLIVPIKTLLFVSLFLLFSVLLALIFGDELDQQFNVIGIRIATLIVAFAAFISSSMFSLLIFSHNRTVSRINDDTNRRAELFRELQFASGNYSIIDFMDRMLIYDESTRYVDKFMSRPDFGFHMIENHITKKDVLLSPEKFQFTSIKIPFRVIEGKVVSAIFIEKLSFERNGQNFVFTSSEGLSEVKAHVLYNENTKRNNVIINLITTIDSEFFISSKINLFTKIKIFINVNSLLGVRTKGVSELYFTNPEQIEGNGTNTYKINSSNFTLIEMPKVTTFHKE